LIGKADSKNIPGKFTWDEINRFMTNIGQEEFDYDTFKLTFDADPNLQKLVARFDQEGIELKTKKQEPAQGPVDGNTGSDAVAQMAKHATNTAMAA
jgi:hypothetical protein